MKTVGNRNSDDFGRYVGAEGLRALDRLNKTVSAIAKPTGCPKGIYRFKNHEDKNAFDDALVIASIVAKQKM